MKINKLILLTALALGTAVLPTFSQDGPPPAGQSAPTGASGSGLGAQRPPKPPIEAVLDANGDGIISADEIANASVALKKLDKNGDGQLTPDEYRPIRPRPGQHGPDDASGPGVTNQQPTPGGNSRQIPRGQRPPPPNQ